MWRILDFISSTFVYNGRKKLRSTEPQEKYLQPYLLLKPRSILQYSPSYTLKMDKRTCEQTVTKKLPLLTASSLTQEYVEGKISLYDQGEIWGLISTFVNPELNKRCSDLHLLSGKVNSKVGAPDSPPRSLVLTSANLLTVSAARAWRGALPRTPNNFSSNSFPLLLMLSFQPCVRPLTHTHTHTPDKHTPEKLQK